MALRRPERPGKAHVPDAAPLSQYGRSAQNRRSFRSAPRHESGEVDISLVLGRLSVVEITAFVAARHADAGDAVRYTTAGALRARGFVVQSTPTRRIPGHVSVTAPGGQIPWDDRTSALFEECFKEGGE